MIETKVESQNYLPYNNLGPLPFEYVIQRYQFSIPLFFFFITPLPPPLSFSFRLRATCHLSNGHERGVIQSLEATLRPSPLRLGLDRPLATIHQFSLSHALDRR